MERFENWEFPDSFPTLNLDDIYPTHYRMSSLVSRNKNLLDSKLGGLRVMGAIQMVEGMEYHYSKYCEMKGTDNRYYIKHELVAYFNRLGQFYYFSQSAFVKSYIHNPSAYLLKIEKYIIFRMKNVSHRSLDSPKTTDKPWDQIWHSLTFMGFHDVLENGNYDFMIKDGKSNQVVHFVPDIEHKNITNEIYSFFEELISQIISQD